MKYFTLLILALIAVTINSCVITDGERIRGNGNVTTKSFDLKNFSSVEVDDNMTIVLKQDSDYAVKVETDENLQPYVNVNIQDGKELVIKYKNDVSLHPSKKTKVFISTPLLDKIDIGSASELQTDGKFSQDKKLTIDISEASSASVSFRSPFIDMTASEASTISINGESRDIKVRASEASTINAFDLKAENVDATASEASTAHVFGSVSLKLNATEASTIKYRGSTNVVSNAKEASNISKAD